MGTFPGGSFDHRKLAMLAVIFFDGKSKSKFDPQRLDESIQIMDPSSVPAKNSDATSGQMLEAYFCAAEANALSHFVIGILFGKGVTDLRALLCPSKRLLMSSRPRSGVFNNNCCVWAFGGVVEDGSNEIFVVAIISCLASGGDHGIINSCSQRSQTTPASDAVGMGVVVGLLVVVIGSGQ